MGTVGSQTTTKEAYSQAWLPPRDASMIYRLVGYFEYSRALSLLDQLLNQVTAEELKVIEEIVKEQNQFAIETNLSRKLQQQPSTLAELPQMPNDTFERRGLGWVMGLARVELAAMMTGFTAADDPFFISRPSRYELPQYLEVLEDAARTHYWALRNDPVTKNFVRAGLTEPQAIAYFRRITTAMEFLKTARTLRKNELVAAQRKELDRWEEYLNELHWEIVYGVLKLGTVRATTTKTNEFGEVPGDNCPRVFDVKDLKTGKLLYQDGQSNKK